MQRELWEWGCRHICKVSARMKVRGWERKPREGSGTWGCLWELREKALTKQARDWELSGWWVGLLSDLRTSYLATLHPKMCQEQFGGYRYKRPTSNTSLKQVPQKVCMHPQPFAPCAWDCCWPEGVSTPHPPQFAPPLPWPGSQAACTTSWPNYIQNLAPFCCCSLTYLPPQPL